MPAQAVRGVPRALSLRAVDIGPALIRLAHEATVAPMEPPPRQLEWEVAVAAWDLEALASWERPVPALFDRLAHTVFDKCLDYAGLMIGHLVFVHRWLMVNYHAAGPAHPGCALAWRPHRHLLRREGADFNVSSLTCISQTLTQDQ